MDRIRTTIPTSLQRKHFNELIEPFRHLMNTHGDCTAEIVREVVANFERFGFVLTPIGVMTKHEAELQPKDLAPDQRDAAIADMEGLFSRLVAKR